MRACLACLRSSDGFAIRPQAIVGFIVFSSKDEVLLRKLMRGLTQKNKNRLPLYNLCRVAMRKEQPRHAPTKGATESAAGEAVTLIETLNLSSKAPKEADAWYNYLLDVCNGEDKMVFTSAEEAEKHVYEASTIRAQAIACPEYQQPGRKVFKRNKTTGNEHVGYCHLPWPRGHLPTDPDPCMPRCMTLTCSLACSVVADPPVPQPARHRQEGGAQLGAGGGACAAGGARARVFEGQGGRHEP